MIYLQEITFHPDIDRYLYYADSPLQNYWYEKTFYEKLGIEVVMGNVRDGVNIWSREEPSALHTQFLILKPDNDTQVGKVSKYACYRSLNPYQRYEYLQVLHNPYQHGINIAYLNLLFCCMERRLHDGDESVITIMHKLADFHQGKFKESVDGVLYRYQLWKDGSRSPENCKVFLNRTLYRGCYTPILGINSARTNSLSAGK